MIHSFEIRIDTMDYSKYLFSICDRKVSDLWIMKTDEISNSERTMIFDIIYAY